MEFSQKEGKDKLLRILLATISERKERILFA